jgi:hypothetical protein
MCRVDRSRDDLTQRLADHYRGQGWTTRTEADGTILADGPGGVTWIGAGITSSDLSSGGLDARLAELADRRMPHGGELCPLELLPATDCVAELEGLLERLGLAERRHVVVYSLAS